MFSIQHGDDKKTNSKYIFLSNLDENRMKICFIQRGGLEIFALINDINDYKRLHFVNVKL